MRIFEMTFGNGVRLTRAGKVCLTVGLLAVLWLVAMALTGCASTPKQQAVQFGIGLKHTAEFLDPLARGLHRDGYLSEDEIKAAEAAYNKYARAELAWESALNRVPPTGPLTEEVLLNQAAMSLYVNDLRQIVWAGLERKEND